MKHGYSEDAFLQKGSPPYFTWWFYCTFSEVSPMPTVHAIKKEKFNQSMIWAESLDQYKAVLGPEF